MDWSDVAGNMHMHTPYSDGTLYHKDIALAALAAGLDFIIVTDHNVWVHGPEGYVEDGQGKRVLVLVGEEVHDQAREPQGNHLLVYGAEREVASLAPQPQALLDGVREAGGLSFLAHPYEIGAPLVGEGVLPWFNWEVEGFTGLEIWNYMSEFKSFITSKPNAIRAAFNPDLHIAGPFPETLARWDELLSAGKRIVGIGGADAHGTTYRMGALQRVIFPYEFLFRAVNTHVLLENEFSGEAALDKRAVLSALRRGRCFIGYDFLSPTRGFRFAGAAERETAVMGDEVGGRSGVTLQIVTPARASLIRLIANGKEVARWKNQANGTYITSEPGAYRAEAYREYRGKQRCWILSNPIYVV